MNKQEREQAKAYKLMELITKTPAINNLTARAEPFVKEYWNILKDLWTKKIGFNEAGRIKEQLSNNEFKGINNEYRKLLK